MVSSWISFTGTRQTGGRPSGAPFVVVWGRDPSIFRTDAENRAAHARSVTFRIGCDQVGTVRALIDPDGTVVKRLEYDSFGLPLLDTCPYFFFPLGFAGGLVDRHTGLVRFGFRDYDPRTGRFTAPDPLGDTGGDHDLYDYCVDDPVSAYDPTGLIMQGLAARGWDESKHPRTPDGRFTYAHGGVAARRVNFILAEPIVRRNRRM